MFPESERLQFRRLTEADFDDVASVLLDEETTRLMQISFTEERAALWLEKLIRLYDLFPFNYWHVSRKEDGRFIGIMGIVPEKVLGEAYVGLGYLVQRDFWRQGYASEGTRACVQWAFDHIDTDEIIAEIAIGNLPSVRVAEKLGMEYVCEYLRPAENGVPHALYSLKRSKFQ